MSEVFHVAEATSAHLAANFYAGLTDSKATLFTLADQVSAAASYRCWDMLLGDDTSGRLVTRFVRKVLELQGYKIPTRYICAAHATRQSVTEEQYSNHVSNMTSTLKERPEYVLLISEKTSSGQTAMMLASLLGRYFAQIDMAFLTTRYGPPPISCGQVFLGSPQQEAGGPVYRTFERAITDPLQAAENIRIRQAIPEEQRAAYFREHPLVRASSSYPLTNLIPTEGQPFAAITPDTSYRKLAKNCFDAMDNLAVEFYGQRSSS